MLPVQVSYWSLLETKEHNRATEEQARRELKVTEALGYANLQETSRHNLAMETETHRSNLEQEGLRRFQNYETQRSNLVNEGLTGLKIANERTKIQNDYIIGLGNLEVNRVNANTNRLNALTRQYADTLQAESAWNNSVTNRIWKPVEVQVSAYRAGLESDKLQNTMHQQVFENALSIANLVKPSTVVGGGKTTTRTTTTRTDSKGNTVITKTKSSTKGGKR